MFSGLISTSIIRNPITQHLVPFERLTILLMELQSPVLRLLYLEGCFCYDESELINKADIKIYKQLLEIDSKLGTTQTEQLFSPHRQARVWFH